MYRADTSVVCSQSAGLVSGWDHMAVVDLRDGYILASHSLPCHPLTKPVLGDFNGDGWTDVLVACPEGYVLVCCSDIVVNL